MELRSIDAGFVVQRRSGRGCDALPLLRVTRIGVSELVRCDVSMHSVDVEWDSSNRSRTVLNSRSVRNKLAMRVMAAGCKWGLARSQVPLWRCRSRAN